MEKDFEAIIYLIEQKFDKKLSNTQIEIMKYSYILGYETAIRKAKEKLHELYSL